MTITRRVPGDVGSTIAARVPDANETESSFDAWGGSWADSWGDSWRVMLALSVLGITQRVASAPSANVTKRVTI